MLTRRGVLTLACALAFAGSASVASAQTIPVTAHITADNHYALYVGNADGTELTFIGRNEYGYWGNPGTYNWSLPETWTFDIRADQYVYIAAWDESASGGVSMMRADLQSPQAVLVTDRIPWQSAPIPSGFPGDNGDANPNDILAAIVAGGWVNPLQKEAGTSTTWVGYPAVPGIRPEAFYIWHSPNAPYVLFRASAASLLYPPPPTCEEQLAEAQAEVARLGAALEGAQQDLVAALADVERLTAALAMSQQNLAALDALLQSLVADLQNDFRHVFGDPTFVIPGATPNEQLQALVQALKGLERGPKLQVYRRLGGRLGM